MQKISLDDLKNKICVITGGGGVIGASLAQGLASLGVKTVVLDLSMEASNRVAEKIKHENSLSNCQVSKTESEQPKPTLKPIRRMKL